MVLTQQIRHLKTPWIFLNCAYKFFLGSRGGGSVKQLKALQYHNVAFITDCKKLTDELYQLSTEKTITSACHTEVSSMLRDIHFLSRSCNYSFHFANRTFLENVDVLAKQARLYKQNYVITWFS